MNSESQPTRENVLDAELQEVADDLKKKESRIKQLEKELSDCWKIEEIIIAAGLLDKQKFEQARDIIACYT